MDPVVSSLAGDGFPPLLIFRELNTPHTRIATQMALRAIRPLELNQGTAKRCRIAKRRAETPLVRSGRPTGVGIILQQ
jgi:hypothetical protein